jgi:hypothetical protein
VAAVAVVAAAATAGESSVTGVSRDERALRGPRFFFGSLERDAWAAFAVPLAYGLEGGAFGGDPILLGRRTFELRSRELRGGAACGSSPAAEPPVLALFGSLERDAGAAFAVPLAYGQRKTRAGPHRMLECAGRALEGAFGAGFTATAASMGAANGPSLSGARAAGVALDAHADAAPSVEDHVVDGGLRVHADVPRIAARVPGAHPVAADAPSPRGARGAARGRVWRQPLRRYRVTAAWT